MTRYSYSGEDFLFEEIQEKI